MIDIRLESQVAETEGWAVQVALQPLQAHLFQMEPRVR